MGTLTKTRNSVRPNVETTHEHRAWFSRGYVPHIDVPGLTQFITFRLFDSMPAAVVKKWRQELGAQRGLPQTDPKSAELRMRIQRYLDSGYGACWLREDRVAQLVEDSLLHFDGVRYRLLGWVVMPNHVHTLIETYEGFPLDRTVHSWKSFTATRANRMLGRKGRFWSHDYYDRYIRDDAHLAAVVSYIDQNPVKAGLVNVASDWPWSSASRS